jgi:hypothetical protein
MQHGHPWRALLLDFALFLARQGKALAGIGRTTVFVSTLWHGRLRKAEPARYVVARNRGVVVSG